MVRSQIMLDFDYPALPDVRLFIDQRLAARFPTVQAVPLCLYYGENPTRADTTYICIPIEKKGAPWPRIRAAKSLVPSQERGQTIRSAGTSQALVPGSIRPVSNSGG